MSGHSALRERIIAAAVLYGPLPERAQGFPLPNDRLVLSAAAPARHHHIINTVGGVLHEVEQGFLTDNGRFVDRRLALKIALAAKQIKARGSQHNELYSEDLW